MKSHRPKPPTLATRILHWFCPNNLLEGIEHDLEEQFQEANQSVGKRRANFLFYWNVIRLFHPSILCRNQITISMMNTALIENHLVVATRSMSKFKFYSIVNVLGLSLSMAFILLVFLFVKKELAYDHIHKNGKQIYRVALKTIKKESGEVVSQSAITAVPLGKKLQREVPAISEASRYASSTVTLIHDNQPLEEIVYFVDPGFLNMFSFPIMQGSDQALQLQNHMVISVQKAKQYFGEMNPIGKSLSFDLNGTVTSFIIQAVIDDKSDQSSLAVDFMLPFQIYAMTVSPETMESFHYGILENYVLLEPNSNVQDVEKSASATLNFNPDDENYAEVMLQSLHSIHLENEIVGNAAYTNPVKFLIMIGLALLVLIVSVINFMTLSTGHTLVRLKEIGLRKAFGAQRTMLRLNLIIEAFALSFITMLIGSLLAWLLLPLFNQLVDSQIDFLIDLNMFLFIIGTSLLVALVNGGLQSLAIVNFKLINALKEKLSLNKRSGFMNQGLIVIQFTISTVLIIGTLIIRSQMNYVQHKDLGFDRNNLIQVKLSSADGAEAAKTLVARLKTQLLSNSRVISVTASMNNTQEPWTSLTFRQMDNSAEELAYNLVGYDYLETMGIDLVAGEFFNKNKGNPSADIVVNEALVKHFGWENPLEEQIPGTDFNEPHNIIGVVKDFHFSNLKSSITPLILTVDSETLMDGVKGLSTYMWPPNLYQLYARFTPGEIVPVIDHVSDVWKQNNASAPFTYKFVDDMVAQQYQEEDRWADIVNVLSVFSILIAWMGLIGLTRLSVQRRTKEIGIRKVLGSSVMNVTSLLSKQFLLLVLIANLIAWPVSYWLADSWLASFTYHVTINPLIFLISGLTVMGLVTLSVGLQSLLAAKTNPVESLRYE